eukprot:9075722-Pyramimonas_sp.AAC.3
MCIGIESSRNIRSAGLLREKSLPVCCAQTAEPHVSVIQGASRGLGLEFVRQLLATPEVWVRDLLRLWDSSYIHPPSSCPA